MARIRRSTSVFGLFLLASISLWGQGSMGRTEHYFPQVVVGGGSTSIFVIYNPNPVMVSVDLRIWRANGTLLSRRNIEVAAGGTSTVTAGGVSGVLTVGWADLTATQPFEVTEFFQIRVGAEALPRVGVLSSEPSTRLRLFCFAGEGVRTGVAVANPGTTAAGLTVRRYRDSGGQVELRQTQLEGRHQLARFLDESPFFPGLTECGGSVEIESTTPLVAVTLRSDDNLLASAPVMTPAEALAPGSVGTELLADGAVTNPKLAAGSVTAAKIAAGQVVKSLNGLADNVTLSAGPNISISPSGHNLTISAAAGSGGDITAVTAGAGLVGGGSSGDVEVSMNPDVLGWVLGLANTLGQGTQGQVLGTDGRELLWKQDSLTMPYKFDAAWPFASNEPGIFIHTPGVGTALSIQMGGTGYWSLSGALDVRVDGSSGYSAISGNGNNGSGVVGGSQSGAGVLGASNYGFGVRGWSAWGPGGVKGESQDGDGLVGVTSMANKSGVYAVTSNSEGYAGYFGGKVHVGGELTKAAGGFKIDHPLDPESRYLYHSFVESPDMKNVYDGVVTLDWRGEAWVELPDWFEALNRDFRYQLTALDVPGPNLHVAKRIEGNRFKVAGGMPGAEVSWMVTGIRQDAFANSHRIPVEQGKPTQEQGLFLHPEAFGRGKEASIEWIYHAEALKDGHPIPAPSEKVPPE